ncbi:MAG: DUF2851 family protein [Chlorobi bacterium]|nr:DUF2851 family protein [Chlorobiota bacterium]
MKEEFLSYLWSNKLLRNDLLTTDNQSLSILSPGTLNRDSGPDFFNARINIQGQTWAGNIEIHINSSDWKKHGHQNDDSYDNIILHVVYNNDLIIKRKSGEKIPCLELKGSFDEKLIDIYEDFMSSKAWIACANSISSVDHLSLHSWLDTIGIERLHDKSRLFINDLHTTNNNFQELFYQKLARAFGFNTNSEAFELLAKQLLSSVFAKHLDNKFQIEALLFGQAGFLNTHSMDDYHNKLKKEFVFLSHKYKLKPLDVKIWKHLRMRPGNFPCIRISQFADLLHKSSAKLVNIVETKKLGNVRDLLECTASAYWDNHYRFGEIVKKTSKKKLGKSSINLLLINTIVPFMFTYGRLNNMVELEDKAVKWLEAIKPENNNICHNFNKLGIKAINAFQSQALIQLHKNYCRQRKCLHCRIGYKLMS